MSEEVSSVIRTLPVKALSLHPTIQHFRHTDKPKARDRFVQAMNDNFNPLAIGTPVAVPREDSEGVVHRHRRSSPRARADSRDAESPLRGLRGIERQPGGRAYPARH